MGGYTKLFSSIVTSTIWREDDKTRIVWITLLALSERDGYVAGSIPGLADMARVSVEECEMALTKLQQPDKYSRSPDHDGRRLEAVEGGWIILNRLKYRNQHWQEDRRERDRIRQQRHRERTKTNVTRDSVTERDVSVTSVTSHNLSDKTETETETKTEKVKSKSKVKSNVLPRQKSDAVDDRHEPVRQYIFRGYREVAMLDPPPWNGRDGKALAELLTHNPSWTIEQMKRLIHNRFYSDEPAGEPAHTWLPYLSRYSEGPLDRFGKVERPSGASVGMKR